MQNIPLNMLTNVAIKWISAGLHWRRVVIHDSKVADKQNISYK